jgi:hypothetical protein
MRRNVILAAALAAAAVLLAGSVPAGAAKVEWKGSKFETASGDFVLLGVGNRYKVGGLVNIYNAGFYVHKSQANAALKKYVAKNKKAFAKFMKPGGGPDWDKVRLSGKFNTWIWKYGFSKKLVMKFKYNVKGKQVVDAYKGSLSKTIGDFDDPKYKDALDTFFDGVNHPVNKGQTMTIKSVGDSLTFSGPFDTFKVEKHWRFRQAIWRIWFGPSPIQEPLKKNLTSYAHKLTWPKD